MVFTMPDTVVEKHPELAMAAYDPLRVGVCSNAVAMAHNACRLEMADMMCDILPTLKEAPGENVEEFAQWWGGFARFAMAGDMVDAMLLETSYKDVLEDFDRDARTIKDDVARFKKCSLERVFRAADKAVQDYRKNPNSMHALEQVEVTWTVLYKTITKGFSFVEDILKRIDAWRRDEIAEHKGLEKKIAEIYIDKKKWKGDEAKRGESLVLLTRWLGTEDTMREWMKNNLSSKDFKASGKWMDDYLKNRSKILDGFYRVRA